MIFDQYSDIIIYFKKYIHGKSNTRPLDLDKLNRLSEYVIAKSSILDKRQDDLVVICTKVTDIIDRYLLQNVKKMREKAFIYKMKGDYFR